jgi:hypothetical protein
VYDRAGLRVVSVLLVLLAAALAAASAPARVGVPAVGNPSIERIVFGGTPANPGIAIIGSELTFDSYYGSDKPAPNPPFKPGGHPGCPADFAGPQGRDYGTRLFIVDKSASPPWAAGRYRPKLGELDCIGLILEQWSSGRIEFRLGSFYRLHHFRLKPGDFLQIAWNHLGTGVHVRYGPDGVKPGS